MSIFHLAYHVDDLQHARAFYGGVLGCSEGRSTETWVDYNFFGHQISLHLGPVFATAKTGQVGDHMVPMPPATNRHSESWAPKGHDFVDSCS